MRPGKRQREMLKQAFTILAEGRATIRATVDRNLASGTRSFERYYSRDSIVSVQARCKRDGFTKVRYCGALGSGTPKPKLGPARFGSKHLKNATLTTGLLNDLRLAERTAFIQEHSVDGKFFAPKKD